MAQTMVLSRLWHFTTRFNIPQHLLRRWQSILKNLFLSRKYERESTHMQLIRMELLCLPYSEGGLQVPMIEKQLKKQRIQFLQQFANQSGAEVPNNWTRTGMEILKYILPDFRPFKPLDILTISPRRQSTMVHWTLRSSGWNQTCVWWSQSHWDVTPKDLSEQEQYVKMLHAPSVLKRESKNLTLASNLIMYGPIRCFHHQERTTCYFLLDAFKTHSCRNIYVTSYSRELSGIHQTYPTHLAVFA